MNINTNTKWKTIIIPQWYGQTNKKMWIHSSTALWYKGGEPIVPIRWVLLKDPEGKIESRALLATDLNMNAQQIINYFIRRWTLEVTFEEVRRHLGVESQRQWSDLAIARTTPMLMALFSLVTLWAYQLEKQRAIKIPNCAWYDKKLPTFSDALAAVRIRIWSKQKLLTSLFKPEVNNLNQNIIQHLINIAARAA